MAAICVTLAIVLAACGRSSGSAGAPTIQGLYTSRLAISDVTPIVGDAANWMQAAPTFDVPPLDSATRDDADLGGVWVRFIHFGTAETLMVQYTVWSSTSIATALMDAQVTIRGASLTGPSAGDKALYYQRKLAGGGAPFNNLAYVRVGQTILTIIWSHRDGYASQTAVGKIAVKAASRLKDSLAGKIHPPSPPAVDSLLLAPTTTQLTRLGATVLPIEVLPQILGEPDPRHFADVMRQNGVTDFVFGDYTLNNDTHMEVLTAGVIFSKFPTGGKDFIAAYFGAAGLTATGEGGGWSAITGQYTFGFGTGPRAIFVVCKSASNFEEAGRSCELPTALLIEAWHPLLSSGGA